MVIPDFCPSQRKNSGVGEAAGAHVARAADGAHEGIVAPAAANLGVVALDIAGVYLENQPGIVAHAATQRQVQHDVLRGDTALHDDRDKLLQLIMSSATDLLDAETSSLMLVDDETSELVIAVATGAVGARAEQQRIPIGAGIAGWTLANRQVAIVEDPASDRRFFPAVGESLQFDTNDQKLGILVSAVHSPRDRSRGKPFDTCPIGTPIGVAGDTITLAEAPFSSADLFGVHDSRVVRAHREWSETEPGLTATTTVNWTLRLVRHA